MRTTAWSRRRMRFCAICASAPIGRSRRPSSTPASWRCSWAGRPGRAATLSGRRGSCRGSCCCCARRRSRVGAVATAGRAARGGSTTCWRWCASSSSIRSPTGSSTRGCWRRSMRSAMTGSCRRSCAPRTAGCATASGRGTSCALSGPARERAATQQEWEALLLAARCWRDRFLLVLLWFSGLRIGEALGLRRSDLHLMESASALGCPTAGAHLHVVPRENVNGARAKGRRERVVPLAHHVVSYYDLYLDERERCRAAADCDFVLVNLFAAPLGAPMRYSRVAQLFASLVAARGVGAAGDAAHAAPRGGVGADRARRPGRRAGACSGTRASPALRSTCIRASSASARRSSGWPARCAPDRGRGRHGERAGRRAAPRQPEPYESRSPSWSTLPRCSRAAWISTRWRFVPAPSDPLFGYARCPVARLRERNRAHGHEPVHALPAPLRPLAARRRRRGPGPVPGEVTQTRSEDVERLCLVCRTPGHERPVAAQGLCYSCLSQASGPRPERRGVHRRGRALAAGDAAAELRALPDGLRRAGLRRRRALRRAPAPLAPSRAARPARRSMHGARWSASRCPARATLTCAR